MDSKADTRESGGFPVQDNDRAWKLLEELASGAFKEQRRARRWKVFFRLLSFALLFCVVGIFYQLIRSGDSTTVHGTSYTALVEIDGVIGSDDVDADTVISGLRAAFESRGTKGVILRINSPGGSPVQSGYIYDEMRRLRGLYPEIPLYAVIVDIGASGGYYVAAGADQIYADKASLVGSIGVLSSGFGFVEAMEKLGVTRRIYTAGEYKAFNDPFQPLDEQAVSRWQASLDVVHRQFIDAVKDGRGERLADDEMLFTGMVWSGEQAVELGLLDGLGSSGYVARELVGVGEIVDFSYRMTPLERFARDFGAGVVSSIYTVLGRETAQLR